MKSNNTENNLKKRKIVTCIICNLVVLGIACFNLDTPNVSNTEVLKILFSFMIVDIFVVWVYDICNQQ